MDKAIEYLTHRLHMLEDEKLYIENSIQRIEYEKSGIEEKIAEIEKNVDTVYDIFSPHRKSSGFAQSEINSLREKLNELSEYSIECERSIEDKEDEIRCIKISLRDLGVTDYDKEIEEIEDQIDSEQDVDELYGYKILEKQELERQRIARDLHDSSLQILTSMIHKCDICSKVLENDPIRAKLELEVMSKSIHETIDEMRKIIFDLRPMSFDDLGMETTLKRVIEKKQQDTGTALILKINGEILELSPTLSLTIIRIIQEGIANVIKHSNANNMLILLEYEDSGINIIMEDDGVGFDVNIMKNKSDGFGLSMLKERVFLLGGNIAISSIIGKGTRIDINIPLDIV